MGDSTTTRRRGIGHNRNTGLLKQIGQPLFRNVSAKFYPRIFSAQLAHGIAVSGGLRMIPARHDELRVGQTVGQQIEGFHHQLEPLVGSPLAEGENALLRISTPGKIGELRPARENPVRAQMHIVPAIFVIQNLAVAGHQHRDGVRQ